MNCSLFLSAVCLFLLLTETTISARWELTDFNKQFTSITARNGMLVGIEEKKNLPHKWEKPLWKKLSDEEFFSLATDGRNIIGIKQSDSKAYMLDGRSVNKIGQQINIAFDQLAFSKDRIIGRGKAPFPFIYSWQNSDTTWQSVGNLKFWNIDASGQILCGIQSSFENKALNNIVFIWANKQWQPLEKPQLKKKLQFKQIFTNGTKIIGIGLEPQNYVFEWTGTQWTQHGKEKFTQIAFDQNILCGIQEKIQLILLWTGKKWIALDTKKFISVVTDGKNIYGLANDKKVYFWTKR